MTQPKDYIFPDRDSCTVQFSLIYNGWTVLCSLCHLCLGAHGRESEAQGAAVRHRLAKHYSMESAQRLAAADWTTRPFHDKEKP